MTNTERREAQRKLRTIMDLLNELYFLFSGVHLGLVFESIMMAINYITMSLNAPVTATKHKLEHIENCSTQLGRAVHHAELEAYWLRNSNVTQPKH